MIELPIRTTERNQLINITTEVQSAVGKSKAKNGICVVYCPHTTTAIAITEKADAGVLKDIISKLAEFAPHGKKYFHEEGNSDAHIKSSIIGNSRIVLFKDGRLMLGTWEGIFFCEFDGPRDRKILLSILGE